MNSNSENDHIGWGGAEGIHHKDDVGFELALYEQQLDVFHSSIGDVDFIMGLYGDKGEERVGFDSTAVFMEVDLDFGEKIGSGAILATKVEVGRARCEVSAGEDGASFFIGANACRYSLDMGVSNPNNHCDGQATLAVSVGVGLPGGALHWSDDDDDGYREFGFSFKTPVAPGVSLTTDFKFEIGVSDKMFGQLDDVIVGGFTNIGKSIGNLFR